jgi:citrate/tricarballylate utilization protein
MPGGDRTLLPMPTVGPPTGYDDARRQLAVCNSCRYCEGLCAVFPALERRSLLTDGDISHLANLCHDCRACFTACMYVPPHEFDLNIPKALSTVRHADYRSHVWPRRVPAFLRGQRGFAIGALAALAVTLVAAGASRGWDRLTATPSGAASPYEVIAYPALLAIVLVPTLFSLAVIAGGVRHYLRTSIPGPTPSVRSALRGLWDGLRLRYLRGGGGDCFYPEDDQPSAVRRRLHFLLAGGFLLCIVSTASAAVLQDFLGSDPPYAYLSVPVIAGMAGGAGIVVGGAGLLVLKRRSSPVTSTTTMSDRDVSLITALLLLALTGMLTTFVRTTPAFGLVFLTHLSLVLVCFLIWPYTKFVHFVYRLASLVRHESE